jgi:hypothetical protein
MIMQRNAVLPRLVNYRLLTDPRWGLAQARLELTQRARYKPPEDLSIQVAARDVKAEEATRDAYTWVTEHTETYNEHWVEEKRPSPYERFPRFDYFEDLFKIFAAEQITWIEKSRDLMVSWACVAYLTINAMRVPHRGVLFQTQKDDKVIQLVDYAKWLYRRQPQWLQDAYPLTKPIDQQPEHSLSFAAGGYVVGIPGGADQVRSYHPWGYLNDESSFQADAGECYNEAISAVKGKMIFNSSAGPGWYADARHDIIRTAED